MSDYTKQDILNMIEDEDVRFVRLQFTDMTGHMKNLAITTSRIEEALDNRCVFDGSAIRGFTKVENSNLYLKPDLNTFEIFPWRPHQGKVARLICDVYTPEGNQLEGDPRYILKKVISEAEEMGYTFYTGTECEFYLFKTDDSGKPTMEPSDEAGYCDLAPLDTGENCRREICMILEDMNYEIEASHHEFGPGQHEISFKDTEALDSADKIVTFRTVVKTIAQRHGFHATFMPKPIQDQYGSGMHITMSLMKDGKNAFYNPDQPGKLSDTAYKFMAGILKYTPDMACITNPTVNSYKRFTPGFEAPSYISWSESNNSLLIRTSNSKDAKNARIEFRSPDSTSNPYLALAACLKAGLKGIKEDISLPPSIDVNMYGLTDKEREALGIKNLPISLNEAVKIAKHSDFVKELLGEEFARIYLNSRSEEYEEYRKTVNQWEIEKYLISY